MKKEEAKLIEKTYQDKIYDSQPVYFENKTDGFQYFLLGIVAEEKDSYWDVYFTLRRYPQHDNQITINHIGLIKNFSEL